MQKIAAKLDEICDRLGKLEAVVQKLVTQTMTKEERNALRRQYYRQQKEAERKDRLILPDEHVLNYRDDRLEPFHEVGRGRHEVRQARQARSIPHLVRA